MAPTDSEGSTVDPRSSLTRPEYAAVRRLSSAGFVSGLLCLIALVYLVWRNAASLPSLQQSFEARYLIGAFAFHAVALVTAAFTWHRIVATVAGETNRPRNLRIYVTTAFARRLPGSVWGPALRMYWYRRLGGDWRTVGIASILEVWALTVSGAILTLIGAVLFIGPAASVRTWLGLLAILGILAAMLTPRVNSWLMSRFVRLLRAPSSAERRPLQSSELIRWVAIEFMNWFAGGLLVAAILRAFTPIRPDQLPIILACWAAAGTAGMLITFVPGGFGVVELALTGLLGLIVSAPVALAAAVGIRVFVTACELFWMAAGFTAPFVLNGIRSKGRR